MKQDIEVLPERLYVDSCLWISPKKGNVKTHRYILQKVTANSEYIRDIYTFYKMTGLDLKHELKEYLDNCNEMVIEYRHSSNGYYISTIEPVNYDNYAVYKIIGRNIVNPNRAFINKKTKDTLAKREKMAADIPMLLKVTSSGIVVSRVVLLEYLNKELEKKGYKPLPKDRTCVEVD